MATAKPTCDLATDYNYHTRVFYNYNPATGDWGVLYFQEGAYYGINDGTCPEGCWVARDTDMDFCCVYGKSHDGIDVFLIPYNGIINRKIVKNGYFTGQTIPNVTPNTDPNISQVHAQDIEESSIELHIGDKTYIIDSKELEELKNSNFW